MQSTDPLDALPPHDLAWRPQEPDGAYRLFLDDLRFPASVGTTILARSSSEAIDVVRRRGMPSHVDFDHDLGGDDTAMLFVHWLVDHVLDGNADPGDVARMTYAVHSSNPVGRGNIEGLMDNLASHCRETPDTTLSPG